MSWLDSIGGYVPTAFNDFTNDWNRIWGQDENVGLQVLEAGGAGINAAGTVFFPGAWQALNKVGQAAQATAGVAGRALTAPIALSHPEWGQQLGLNGQQYHDKVMGSIFDLDSTASPGQIAISSGNPMAAAVFGGFPGQYGANTVQAAQAQGAKGPNPYDDKSRNMWFEDKNAPLKYQSGWTDAGFSITLDPTNIAGPAGKVTKVATLGTKAINYGTRTEGLLAKVGSLTSTTPEKFIKGVEDGSYSHLQQYHRDNYGAGTDKFLGHDLVSRRIDPEFQQSAAQLLNATPPENFTDLMRLLSGAGTDGEIAAAADRLTRSFTTKPGESTYLVDRIKSGVAERTWAAENGSELLLDPQLLDKQNAMLTDRMADSAVPEGMHYQGLVAKLEGDALKSKGGVPWLTATPMRGPAARLGNARAASRADAYTGVSKVVEPETFSPEVTIYQPTPQHPVIAIVDRTANRVKNAAGFFTTLRPEGIFRVNDSDAWREGAAYIRQSDKYLDGALTTVTDEQKLAGAQTEASMWMDRLTQDSQAARGKAAVDLSHRVFMLHAAKYGLTSDAAEAAFNELRRRQLDIKAQLKQTKGEFTSIVDRGGDPIVSVDPVLKRENVDNIEWFMDPREVDRALRRMEPEQWNGLFKNHQDGIRGGLNTTAAKTMNGVGAVTDSVTPFFDALNNAFKTTVLMRAGYTTRNLGEAFLSMAASGHAISTAMSAFADTPQMAKNWLLNRKLGTERLIDDVHMRTGKAAPLGSYRYNEQAKLARVNHFAALRDEFLDRAYHLPISGDLSPRAAQQIAQLRAVDTLDHTYHVTTDGLPEIKGDFLPTFSSHSKANAFAGEKYDYYSPYEDSLGSVSALAQKASEVAADPSKFMEYQLATGDWAYLSPATVERWVRERTNKEGVFRAHPTDRNFHLRVRDRGAKPTVATIPSYGKHVDFSDGRSIPAGLDVNDRPALAAWARENGVGRITVKDPEWGKQTLVLRDTAEYKGGEGYMPLARKNAQEILDTAGEGVQTVLPRSGRRENRAKRKAYAAAVRKSGTPVKSKLVGVKDPLFHDYTEKTVDAWFRNDVVETAKSLAELHAQAKVDYEYARNERLTREQQVAASSRGKRVLGTDPSGAFYGDMGAMHYVRSSASDTVDRLWSDGHAPMAAVSGATVNTVVQPGTTRYFEGWANALNNRFRGATESDPLINQLLKSGKAGTEDWLMLSKEGRAYRQDMGWYDVDAVETAVQNGQSAISLYMPKGSPMRQAFLDGEPVTEDMIRDFSAKTGHAPPLKAELVPMTAEYYDKVTYAGNIVTRSARKMMHYLGSLPEDTFARHPLYRSTFDDKFRTLTHQAAARKGDTLTAGELNRLRARAAEHSRQEVNRTLFTINRRSDAATSLRLMSPFYAAWDNQVRRWTGFALHHPDSMSQLASKMTLASNNMLLVDKNGDPITMSDALTPGKVQDVTWITPFVNASGMDGSVKVSLQSLDIVTSGQPGPGAGPFATIPLYELVKNRPEAVDMMKWAFPTGVPENELDMLMPNFVRKMKAMNEDSKSFGNTEQLIAATEQLRWWKHERPDEPTLEEIQAKTNQLLGLKTVTSLLAPFSVQYGSEIDFYKQALRDLQDVYRDQPNGQQLADAAFLQQYPEAFIAMPSFSKNNTGAMATVDAVKNQQRYKNIGVYAQTAGDPKLAGFVFNYGLKYDKNNFSPASYSWQFTHNSGAGTSDSRTTQSADELYKNALVDRGWVQFSTTMDAVDGEMRSRGIDPGSVYGLKVLQAVRKRYAESQRFTTQPDGTQINNPWFQDYNDSNKAKYDERADFFQKVLGDETFMKDHGQEPFIKSIATYLSVRAEVGRVLLANKQAGGSASISSKKNDQIQAQFNAITDQLRRGNLEFSTWIDRYFTNDSVVMP